MLAVMAEGAACRQRVWCGGHGGRGYGVQVVVSWFWAMMLGSGSSSSVSGLHPNFCTGASSVLAELGI